MIAMTPLSAALAAIFAYSSIVTFIVFVLQPFEYTDSKFPLILITGPVGWVLYIIIHPIDIYMRKGTFEVVVYEDYTNTNELLRLPTHGGEKAYRTLTNYIQNLFGDKVHVVVNKISFSKYLKLKYLTRRKRK